MIKQIKKVFQVSDIETLSTLKAAIVGYNRNLQQNLTIAQANPVKYGTDVLQYWKAQTELCETLIKSILTVTEANIKLPRNNEIQQELEQKA